MKVFWLFNHPAPYKVDFFNILGRYCDLDVLFERSSEKGRNRLFYSEAPLSFHSQIAHSLYLGGFDNYTHSPIEKLKKNSYDLVVINGWRTVTEQSTIRYCKRKGIPYVFYINGGIQNTKEAGWIKRMKTRYISGANAYLCPDETSASYLQYYGASKDKITLYPYSSVFEKEVLDHPLNGTEKQAIRNEFGIQGKNVYVSSGQFIERKNFEELIQLWPSMPKEDTLYIIGEGPLKEKYEKMKEELGLTNLFFLPFLPHEKLLRFFRACDGFIFLSKYDIYGHVINEALSQGLPVVSGDNINAARHLIVDGQNGYMYPLNENQNILEAMKKILEPGFSEAALSTARLNTIETSVAFHVAYFESLRKGFPRS